MFQGISDKNLDFLPFQYWKTDRGIARRFEASPDTSKFSISGRKDFRARVVNLQFGAATNTPFIEVNYWKIIITESMNSI